MGTRARSPRWVCASVSSASISRSCCSLAASARPAGGLQRSHAGPRVSQRHLDQRPLPGQRRTQLVRGVGDEPPLRVEGPVQPLDHASKVSASSFTSSSGPSRASRTCRLLSAACYAAAVMVRSGDSTRPAISQPKADRGATNDHSPSAIAPCVEHRGHRGVAQLLLLGHEVAGRLALGREQIAGVRTQDRIRCGADRAGAGRADHAEREHPSAGWWSTSTLVSASSPAPKNRNCTRRAWSAADGGSAWAACWPAWPATRPARPFRLPRARPRGTSDPVPRLGHGLDDRRIAELAAQPGPTVTRTAVVNGSAFSSQTRSSSSSAETTRPTAASSSSEHPELLGDEIEDRGRPGGRCAGPDRRADTAAQHRREGRLRAPAQRLDPRDELDERERLGQVVVGTEVQAGYPVRDVGRGGEHQHAATASGPDQLGRPAVAVPPGQVPIEHDHVVVVDAQVVPPRRGRRARCRRRGRRRASATPRSPRRAGARLPPPGCASRAPSRAPPPDFPQRNLVRGQGMLTGSWIAMTVGEPVSLI